MSSQKRDPELQRQRSQRPLEQHDFQIADSMAGSEADSILETLPTELLANLEKAISEAEGLYKDMGFLQAWSSNTWPRNSDDLLAKLATMKIMDETHEGELKTIKAPRHAIAPQIWKTLRLIEKRLSRTTRDFHKASKTLSDRLSTMRESLETNRKNIPFSQSGERKRHVRYAKRLIRLLRDPEGDFAKLWKRVGNEFIPWTGQALAGIFDEKGITVLSSESQVNLFRSEHQLP